MAKKNASTKGKPAAVKPLTESQIKALQKKREAIGKKFVNEFKRSPAEEQAYALKIEQLRRADVDVLLQAYALEEKCASTRIKTVEKKMEANPFFYDAGEVMCRTRQVMMFLKSIEPEVDNLDEDAKIGLYWIYDGVTDALKGYEEVERAQRNCYAGALAHAGSGKDFEQGSHFAEVLQKAKAAVAKAVRHA